MANDEISKQEERKIRRDVERLFDKIIQENTRLKEPKNLADLAYRMDIDLRDLKNRIVDIVVEQIMMRKRGGISNEANVTHKVEELVNRVADDVIVPGVEGAARRSLSDVLKWYIGKILDTHRGESDELKKRRQARSKGETVNSARAAEAERKKLAEAIAHELRVDLTNEQLTMLVEYFIKPSAPDADARTLFLIIVRRILDIFKDGYDENKYSDFVSELSLALNGVPEEGNQKKYQEIDGKVMDILERLKKGVGRKEAGNAEIVDLATFKEGRGRGPENG